MKLDMELAKDLKRANGDGTRSTRFGFLRKVEDAAQMMRCTAAPQLLPDAIKTYGREAVACALAASIMERQNRLNHRTVEWATAVLDIWTNHGSLDGCTIADNLHPSKIEWPEYAGKFIRLTSEE